MRIITYIFLFILLQGGPVFSKDKINLDKVIKNQPELTIEDLVEYPDEFNGQKVLVEGRVAKVRYTTLPNGKRYTIFKLKGYNKNVLRVYSKGFIDGIEAGLTVRIYGKFSEEKKYIFKKFKNVVKAKRVLILSTVALNN